MIGLQRGNVSAAGLLAIGILGSQLADDQTLTIRAEETAPVATNAQAQKETATTSEEEALFKAVNAYREQQGRKPLTRQTELNEASEVLAEGIARTGQFSHSAVGGSPAARARAAGYSPTYLAENIYYRGQFREQDPTQLAQRTLQTWINSPGHQANLVSDQVEDCGIAIATDETNGRTYVVMKYGKRNPIPAVTR